MKKTLIMTAIACSAAIASYANAHSGKWLVDGSGNGVKDGSGNCVISPNGAATEVCDPPPAPTPAPVAKPAPAPAPAPAPEPVKIEKAITLEGDALFATNSDALSAEGRQALTDFVNDFNSIPNLEVSSINVVGHADSRGNADYNQGLSERRAASVGNFLISQGINASLIQTSGRGESDPVASNDTAEGRAKNRRVELSLSGTSVTTQ